MLSQKKLLILAAVFFVYAAVIVLPNILGMIRQGRGQKGNPALQAAFSRRFLLIGLGELIVLAATYYWLLHTNI